MKLVTQEQAERLFDATEEGLVDSVGAVGDVIVEYATERFPKEVEGMTEWIEFDDFLNDKLNIGCGGSRWDLVADLFNFNEKANAGFWSMWNSFFVCTACGKAFNNEDDDDDDDCLTPCSGKDCVNSMCRNCLTVVEKKEPKFDEENTIGGLKTIPGEFELFPRPYCKQCDSTAIKPTKAELAKLMIY